MSSASETEVLNLRRKKCSTIPDATDLKTGTECSALRAVRSKRSSGLPVLSKQSTTARSIQLKRKTKGLLKSQIAKDLVLELPATSHRMMSMKR